MIQRSIALIFYYQNTGKYALNVLAGAVSAQATLKNVELSFAKNTDELISLIKRNAQHVHSVVTVWTFYSPGFAQAAAQLQWVKQQTTGIDNLIHIAGGVHATAEPEQTLDAGFDFIGVGEGEQIILDVLRQLSSGIVPSHVQGIAYKINNSYVQNGKGRAIDINEYPAHAARFRKFGPVEITRGCVFGCKFCQTPFVNKARFRHRSLENIREQINVMVEYGLRDYRFITPTSLSYGSQDESVNLHAIEALLAMVREIIGKSRRLFYGTFPSEIRPEHVTPQALSILKKYVSNDNLIIGGQSGSQAVLDYSNRGHQVEDIERAVCLCVESGFKPNVDFLLGMPGEQPEDVAASVKFADALSTLGARIHMHTFMPLPGTPFQDKSSNTIPLNAQQHIVELTARGKVYGQWQGQMAISEQLTQLRKTSIRRTQRRNR